MSEQFNFSLKVLDEWKQIWNIETIDYLKTAQEKVFFSIMDLNSYYYVQNELNKKNEIWLKEFEDGKPFELPSSLLRIDYYYTEQPVEIFMSKISLNFFGTVHSFFDTYAHFLHRALFPQDPLPYDLNFHKVRGKIKSDNSMKDIKDKIKENERVIQRYVGDINNMNKHRKHIHPISELNFVTGEQSFSFPAFKKGQDYEEKVTKETLESSCKMIIEFYNEVTKMVYDYSVNVKTSLQ
ncbi:hypothetical protein [Paenibacillus polymyxa]|uniref:hypothetical protein n=1 Tax=Paenibacillus polymyxa TaxID=1406 RepID=UPI0008FB6951|nr:hypothetical protein [Paenibacillus polymyxa]APB75610.1 hypothetical protein PPYC2_11735 [Paenibacillus polymyxa]POR25557.1 hypothetical protein CG775_21810 [Paenibacillus polymyxa]